MHDKLGPATSGMRRYSDQDLQISRRLDWRFLLPVPHLRRVAYLGSRNDVLLAALSQLSDSLTIISGSSWDATLRCDQSGFDLAVVRSGGRPELEIAHSLLIPGGLVYWEIDRFAGFRTFRTLASGDLKKIWRPHVLRDSFGLLEGLGFCQIEVYWHRPNFEECIEIIPLRNPFALNHVFSRHRVDFPGRLKLAVGWCLLKSSLLSHLVACFSLIARKCSISTGAG